MKTFQQIFLLFFITVFLNSASAAGDSKFTFEPIYGVETVLVRYPTPSKYVTRATYGARALYGTTFLSAEAEYTTAQSRNDYPSVNQTVEDKASRASLGLRSTLPMGQFVGLYFRAGGRASQGETKVTTNGVADTKDNPLRIDPYGGAGVQVAFHSNFALNAGVTLIRNQDNQFDTQYTLGLSARIGNP